jgi:ABC-type multidrug transport system fused ATPase/permease subunit
MDSIKILYPFLYDYKFTILIYILLTILAFPLEAIVMPQIYSNFFSILSSKTKLKTFIKYFVIIIAILLIIYSSNSATYYIDSYLIPNLHKYTIDYIFENLILKYENNYTDIELGKIVTTLSNIPSTYKDLFIELIFIFPRILVVLVVNIYFFYLDYKLGIIALIILFLFFIDNIYYILKCSVLSEQRYDLMKNISENTQNKLSNLFSIYSNSNANKEILSHKNITNTYKNKFKDNLFCSFKSTIFSNILIILNYLLLNCMTVYLYMTNKISLTSVIAVFITIIYYTPPLESINNSIPILIHDFGILLNSNNFIKDLHETNLFIKNKIKKNQKEIKNGIITINNLNFSYNKDYNKKLFEKFYLTIKNNEKIAIIGQSGNGKSTLIKLIMGYYNVLDGTIFIDGHDINSFDTNDLRSQISYVQQNSKLFNTTLLKNLQYGNNMSEKDITELLQKMKLDNIFKNLKDGLETDVGVEGNNLSGGQRQLVHIIRAIAKNNKIIILDEPTSAIDKENTINVINIFKELKNRTLILITHDEILLPYVDRIITLDAGKIIDDKYLNKNSS